MRILFAEDEKDLNDIVTKKLKKEGFLVDSCMDGSEAIDCYDATDYDCIILDIMMPKADGYEVLSHIRERKDSTPVIFLTARDAVTERIRGLDSGANDYLVKPFSLEELVARVRAMTRSLYGHSENKLQVSDLVMDLSAHRVERAGHEIELSAKEYQMLEYMMHNVGIVLSRDQIEDHVWNFDYEGGTNVVDVYISYLRKKIDIPGAPKLIKTVRGAGYTIRED